MEIRVQQIIMSLNNPSLWTASFDHALDACAYALPQSYLKEVRSVYITGCGTSYHAAVYGQQMIERFSLLPCAAMAGTRGETFQWKFAGPNTLFIGISHAGTRKAVADTMQMARRHGAKTVAVTGDKNSPLAQICERVIAFPGEEDNVYTKTRSYVESCLILACIAMTLGRDRDQPYIWREKIKTVGNIAQSMLHHWNRAAKNIARHISYASSLTVLGGDFQLSNVYEASQKICEMGWMATAPFDMSNYMYGRFRGADRNCPFMLFVPGGDQCAQALDLLTVAYKKGIKTICITDHVSEPLSRLSGAVLEIPLELSPEIAPLISILPAYLLAMHLGISRGHPDPALRHDAYAASSVSGPGKLFLEYADSSAKASSLL